LMVVRGEPGWEQVLNERQVNVILVPPGSALANALRESPQWKVIYEDKVGTLCERGSP